MTAIFVDTNVLLHYLRLDQIDWLALTGATQVRIILAPVVVSELDNHKLNHHSQKIRKRAQEVCAHLAKLFAPTDPSLAVLIRPGVELCFPNSPPPHDWTASQLDPSVNDDRVLAAIIDYSRSNPTTSAVVVTGDLGMSLKAKSRGIVVLTPNEKDKLPDEADPRDKRIQQLETEIGRLKNAIPELSLKFVGGSDRLSVKLESPQAPDQQRIAKELDDIRSTHPKRGIPDPKQIRRIPFSKLLKTRLSELAGPEEVQKYNQQLDVYYEEYGRFLVQRAEFENVQRRTVGLKIELSNSGKAPAEDIGIYLHFPDGFSLYDLEKTRELPDAPIPPEPPLKPGTFNVPSFDNHIISMRPPGPPPNVSALKITRTHSYDVKCHVQKLKHSYSVPLHGFLIIFDSFADAKSFEIEYRIDAANLPIQSQGRLKVLVDKS